MVVVAELEIVAAVVVVNRMKEVSVPALSGCYVVMSLYEPCAQHFPVEG